MAERRRRLRLATETREELGLAREVGADRLQRDATRELHLHRLVDLAHAAASDGADDLVATRRLADDRTGIEHARIEHAARW